ncbi:hypothetical protein L195_g022543 [Trifolium pratense]|uniref:Uncharacterized protein n=1 Tax=Trifolium pratense TaxID=57577 RepID=A0A2K3N8B0_TRIPR|nr:uncharacterized protein LOC123918055 [Trifolium pratense]PNX99278.1 hypothetical protein L195_g022543 [Trifolium pratense]
MESEDNFTDRVFKPRAALGDVTNRPSKRSLSSFYNDNDDGVDKLAKKNCHNNNNKEEDKGKNISVELPELPLSANNSSQEPSLPSGGTGTGTDDSNDSFTVFCQKSPGRSQNQGFIDREIEHDDNLESSKCAGDAVEPTIESGSKFLGLERCSGLKGHGDADADEHFGGDVGIELLKNCTCSFCTKAAHIWSDLHYQDVKGRLTALKKSQKEARLVVQKFSGISDTHNSIHQQQGGVDPSDLESALMHQWKSLFVHMENILGHESRQLESSFERLKDLREKCKNDLDSTHNSNSGNQ